MQSTVGRLDAKRTQKIVEIHMSSHIHEVPVVDSRATYTVLIDAESEVADQVQRR